MDNEDGSQDGSQDGGTGRFDPKPSTDATACQVPTQAGVPAWILARNNSVHAPVFRQPSVRKSTSRELPSMPSHPFRSRASKSPWAEIRAAIRANDAISEARASEAKATPPPPQISPSMDLDTFDDDQALALLLNNQTVAAQLQNAFNVRVEEHQQKLERAYDQRLLELEEYIRSWRDTTKELWVAVGEGKFNLNNDQQETLSWKGPQDAGHDFDPEQRVTCLNVRSSSATLSGSHFNRQEWINSNGCGSRNFKKYAHKIQSVLTFDHSTRLLFRYKNDAGKIEYRPSTAVESTVTNIGKGDVIIGLTPSNIALLGKAFCYLKVTRDSVRPNWSTDSGMDISAAELAFLFDRFSQQPTKQRIDVFPLHKRKKRINADLFDVMFEVSVVPKRLLIARPTYTKNGSIQGAKFFDVGSDTHTTSQENGEDIVLFEDQISFTRIALLLCYCIRHGIVSVSLETVSPAPGRGRNSLEAGKASTSLQDAQGPHHSSESIARGLGRNGGLQEWIADIKGSTNDFVAPGSKILLFMRSPYLTGRDFSAFLETTLSCGRIFFRLRDSPQNYTYFSWKGNKHMTTPVLRCADIVVDFSIPNLVLLWRAFCVLKDRNNYLLAKVPGPLSEVSRKACDDLHGKLAKHYGGSLLAKKQITLLQSVSLPANGSDTGGVYDSQAEGQRFQRRLVIARPYHQAKRVVGAEFFDIGSSARTGCVRTDIVLIEDTDTLTDIGHLLIEAISMDIFPALRQDHPTNVSTSIEFPRSKSDVPPAIPQTGNSEQSGETRGPTSLDSLRPPLFQRTLALSDGLKELRDGFCHDMPDPQPRNQWLAMGGEPGDVRSPSPSLEQDNVTDDRSQVSVVEEEDFPSVQTDQHIRDDGSDGSENSDLIMLDEQPKNVIFRCREKRPHLVAGQEARMAKKPKLSTAKPSTGASSQLPHYGQAPESFSNLPLGSITRTEELNKKHIGKPTTGLAHSQDETDHESPSATYDPKHQAFPSTVLRAQSLPLGEQHPVEISITPPLPSEMTTSQLHKLREQLRRLGCRFEEDISQGDESTVGGKFENFGQLQVDESFDPPPSNDTVTQRQQLREQLRRLGCRFEEDIDRAGASTFGVKVEESEQLPTEIKRAEGVLEAQRQTEDVQKVDENLRQGAHLPLLDVSNQTMISLDDSDSPFTKPKRATDTEKILTNENKNKLTEGIKLCKPSGRSTQGPKTRPARAEKTMVKVNLLTSRTPVSSINESSALAAPAGPEQFPCTIPTEPKAFRGVPKEPRAMRIALPQQNQTCWQNLDNPRTISVGPISQHQPFQAKLPLPTAPRGSLAMPNQVDAAHSVTRSDSTVLQDHQQPLRTVMSSPPPSRNGNTADPANLNVFATVGQPVAPIGPWDHETQSVPEFLWSADSSPDGEIE